MLRHIFASIFLFSFAFAACGDDPMPPPDVQPPPVTQDQRVDPEDPGVSDVTITDDELESFVEVNIRAGREEVDPQVDPQGFENIIEDKGLNVDRYMEIQVAVQQNPQLQQEIQQLFQELQQS
jgi:hypothetical protein